MNTQGEGKRRRMGRNVDTAAKRVCITSDWSCIDRDRMSNMYTQVKSQTGQSSAVTTGEELVYIDLTGVDKHVARV